MLGPIILDLKGLSLEPEEKELLLHPLVGGVILFTRNYFEKEQLLDLTHSIRSIRSELFICVDHEGGRVQRFTSGFTPLESFASLGKLYDQSPREALLNVEQHAAIMAEELISVGVDFSFTPVVDLEKGISNVIATRSFHRDPNTVSLLATTYIRSMHQHGMASVAKHFPGHGSVTIDTHHAIASDQREFNKILDDDLKPFAHLIKEGVKAIMPAHIIFPLVDEIPVGFSRKWLQTILRQQFRFDGVIISDDLSMFGASMIGNCLERVELALDAGCDLLLICNNRADVVNVLDNLKRDINKNNQARLFEMRNKKL